MSINQALLVFLGIPVAFAALVWVLVSAGSWTRSGRTSADFVDNPFLVVSETAMIDPSRLPQDISTSTVAGGGTSAKW